MDSRKNKVRVGVSEVKEKQVCQELPESKMHHKPARGNYFKQSINKNSQ
jgi:hypothetical protein